MAFHGDSMQHRSPRMLLVVLLLLQQVEIRPPVVLEVQTHLSDSTAYAGIL